jgi:tetratricopeptide (TPR) repeat protein
MAGLKRQLEDGDAGIGGRAEALAGSEELAEADELITATIEDHPLWSEGWATRARLLLLRGEVGAAAQHCLRALKYNARHFLALEVLVLCRMEARDWSGAQEAALKLQRVHPRLAQVRSWCGTVTATATGTRLFAGLTLPAVHACMSYPWVYA